MKIKQWYTLARAASQHMTPARTPRLHKNVVMCHVIIHWPPSSMKSSLHNSINPPTMVTNPPKLVCICPEWWQILQSWCAFAKNGDKSSKAGRCLPKMVANPLKLACVCPSGRVKQIHHAHNPLTPWNHLVNVQLYTPGDSHSVQLYIPGDPQGVQLKNANLPIHCRDAVVQNLRSTLLRIQSFQWFPL